MKDGNVPSTYAKILETGYRLFAEHGFEKTSMTMIAKELKISKPALYYHFVSKETIIDVLFDEICKSIGFHNFFDIGAYSKDNFKEKFISDGLNMISIQNEDMYYARIMNQFQALSYREPKYSQKLIESLDGYTTGFAQLLRHGVSIGVIEDRHELLHAQMLTMIIDSMDNFISYGLEYAYEDIWTKTVLTVLEGDAGK